MVKRVVVGAHYGLRDWLAQRVTAVVMVVYTVIFVAALLTHSPVGFAQWKALFGGGVMRVLTMLFFLSLFYHAWIGVRDILMDYIQPTGVRLFLEVLVILALVGYAIWTISILWSA
jgi:succinate dehydrogenase / fumarate reductase, membrane anchor subunit